MDEARVARALNRWGEDAFLFANDSEDLLELVDEYFGDTTLTFKIRPNLLWLSHSWIINNTKNAII